MTRVSFVTAGILACGLVACGPNVSSNNHEADGGTSDASLALDGHATDTSSCNDTCNEVETLRCQGSILEVCQRDDHQCLVWQSQKDCASTAQVCDDSGDMAACVTPETCDDGVQNQNESSIDCGGDCAPCAVSFTCNNDDDCQSHACTSGVCQVCKAATFACFGNSLQQCANDESTWNEVQYCDAMTGYRCNAQTGTCELVQPLGNDNTNPTGVYYQFAHFTPANSAFQGGGDVDSLNDKIFVNRDGDHVDVYQVTLQDSDGDGKMEPNQHPGNPDNDGPIEHRVLAYVTTYAVPIGSKHSNELYVTSDRIVFSKPGTDPGDLFEYILNTGAVNKIADGAGLWNQVLGYDDVNHIWYSCDAYNRWVYSFDETENEWVLQFAYPNLAGSHNDGLEVVTDPNLGVPYVYVSDMTSDFIGQYVKDATGQWEQRNLFQYNQDTADSVEGMGFGALSHFWVTNDGYGSGEQVLYELGGGDLSHYTDPTHSN